MKVGRRRKKEEEEEYRKVLYKLLLTRANNLCYGEHNAEFFCSLMFSFPKTIDFNARGA